MVAAVALVAWNGLRSDGDSAPEGRAETGELGDGAFDPDRQGPAAPVQGAVEGGTVTVSTAGTYGLKSWDPTAAYGGLPDFVLRGLVTRSLTQYVYDPQQGSSVLVPDLATDLGTPNADFTEWTYTIRSGVRWEDGTEVTADDVAFGVKRSFEPDNGAFSSVFAPAPFSRDFFLDGDTYQGPYKSGSQYSGVVVQGNTLTLKMRKPFPDMPYWAAYPAMGPIPESGSNPATYGAHPLATGPYKVAGVAGRKTLTLVRNDEWDPDTDPGRRQYPDRYVFHFGAPSDHVAATILDGSAVGQTAISYDSPSPDDMRMAAGSGLLTTDIPDLCTHYWTFDVRTFDDIRVRRAVGYAFPYGEALSPFADVLDVTAEPGSSILPPGLPGRQRYSALPRTSSESGVNQAKALLKAAGYAPGEFVVRWPYTEDDPEQKASIDAIVEALESAGFDVRPVAVPVAPGIGEWAYDPQAPIDLRGLAWCGDYPSGSSWLPALFSSDGQTPWALPPSMVKLVDAESERIGALPIDQQLTEWGALDKKVMREYFPALAVSYKRWPMLHGSRIGGMNTDWGEPTWKDIYVSPR
ncbi:MAG TPA: ABC transporter substrate-binding protein [Nocardioidaceae bacterium]